MDANQLELINCLVFLDKAVEPLSQDEIKMILDIGTTLDDLSTIGKMKDFYAINLFSLDNTINAYQSGNKQLFLYLLIYTLVLESFRNPVIEIETRKQICDICILFFTKFYIQAPLLTSKCNKDGNDNDSNDKDDNNKDDNNKDDNNKDDNEKDDNEKDDNEKDDNVNDDKANDSQIAHHRSKYLDGVNFGPTKFMIKILHTLIGLRLVLEHHPMLLGIDRLTTHIIENYFGQNRLNCKGNNRLNRVLHFFKEGAFDYQLIQESSIV